MGMHDLLKDGHHVVDVQTICDMEGVVMQVQLRSQRAARQQPAPPQIRTPSTIRERSRASSVHSYFTPFLSSFSSERRALSSY